MNLRRILIIVFVSLTILMASFAFYLYQLTKSPNLFFVERSDSQEVWYLHIPTGATFRTVLDTLKENRKIHDVTSFAFLAKLMKYQEQVKPGRYRIKANMSNMEALRMLRAGEQAPVKLQFNSIRFKEQLAARIGRQMEFGEEALLEALGQPETAARYGFDTTTIVCMFLPNTYEFYWNISLEKFLTKMHKEYQNFWTAERKQRAERIGLSPAEVITLASIVQSETAKDDEKPRVAGVYLNRLAKGQLLQADPTVLFGLRDFSIKRVLNVHLEVDSPYNTYKYKGLPPGPIILPSVASIEGVLNAERHDFYYFCAKEDFSGYHNFAKTYQEHRQNAKLYYKALNARGIK